jgi:photosystem II stability/assembly factor-like uncharacterized protein
VNTGTVVGDGGTILRTSDGGARWMAQPSGTAAFLYGVSFTDANTGTAVGDGGTILHTTDGGAHWMAQSSGTTNYLYGVCLTDANTGTAVGSGGIILRTTTAGVVTGKDDRRSDIPGDFALMQNYPNPFNSNSNIRYQISEFRQVKLAVYDLLGREVAVLVNERKNAGSYEVKFDAGGLASGVYFYRLQAGDFVHTRKLLLLR